MIGYFFFSLTVVLQASAQILQKMGISKLGELNSIGDLINIGTLVKVLTNTYIMAGIACSVLGLIFWLGALSHFKVSYLFPLGGVTYILLAVMAYFIIGEQITLTKWIGILVIVLGVFLLNR